MTIPPRLLILLVSVIAVCTACKPTPEEADPSQVAPGQKLEAELARVGTFVIYPSDLEYHLQERYAGRGDEGTRKKALDELVNRARFAQAALDAGLDRNPMVRAEVARILSNQLKETTLNPRLKEARATIAESHLRDLYESQKTRFTATEKRRIAVLWLNPGPDPAREKLYQEKLSQARDWFFNSSDLEASPDEGFSVLAVDHSEHAATRFKGGDVGWLEREAGSTDWTRAVAEIGFSLGKTGEVSPVITRPEGVFLVRLMDVKPAVQRSFESVRAELEKEEQRRLRRELEIEFEQAIEKKYPAL